jgi:AcrR family transcriptional regulator
LSREIRTIGRIVLDVTTDGRVLRGEHTRRAVLRRAMEIGSVDGLEGLSIGRLAGELNVSKSGVFAHFGSKEELQLATVRAARAVFIEHVVTPAMTAPPGRERLSQLCERWLQYSWGRVFPGGCFMFAASAEFDARPGRVRDMLAECQSEWLGLLERVAEDTRQLGELPADTDPAQLAFELNAFVSAANSASVLLDDESAYERAARAVSARIS